MKNVHRSYLLCFKMIYLTMTKQNVVKRTAQQSTDWYSTTFYIWLIMDTIKYDGNKCVQIIFHVCENDKTMCSATLDYSKISRHHIIDAYICICFTYRINESYLLVLCKLEWHRVSLQQATNLFSCFTSYLVKRWI